MHPDSLILMNLFKSKYLSEFEGATILDVGSIDINGTYREIFTGFEYTGMDIVPGDNVDIVGYENLSVYDVLISGQVMEHVKHPWDWLKSLKQYFQYFICIISPNTSSEHRHPIDCYRFFPDGMEALFEYADIEIVEIYKFNRDTVGIGYKPENFDKHGRRLPMKGL